MRRELKVSSQSKVQTFIHNGIATALPIVFLVVCVIGVWAAYVVYTEWKGNDKPNYFLRPAHFKTAEERCEGSKGVEGLGVAQYRDQGRLLTKFEALCRNGNSAVWYQ